MVIARPELSLHPHFCHICNTVVEETTNPLLALKVLTDSCGGGSPSRLAINQSRSFRSLAINESWLYLYCLSNNRHVMALLLSIKNCFEILPWQPTTLGKKTGLKLSRTKSNCTIFSGKNSCAVMFTVKKSFKHTERSLVEPLAQHVELLR